MSYTEEQQTAIDGTIQFILNSMRTPILRRPDEYGMEYEDVFFPSLDGTPIEGWYIPAKTKSNKLVICNHFMPGNRYGFAGHLPQYKDAFGGFEVNFLPHYKALHEDGFNILCYDLRNHGLSADTNGRTITFGVNESRDVAGSLKYANSRPDTKGMEKVLLSICLGGNSTLVAMKKYPEYFEEIKAMVLLQPISMQCFVNTFIKSSELSSATYQYMDEKILEGTSFKLSDFDIVPYAPACKVPTKVLQVRKDQLTDISNVQQIFDGLDTQDKEMYWIEGTDQRFQGYNFLGKEPKEMLDWFAKYV